MRPNSLKRRVFEVRPANSKRLRNPHRCRSSPRRSNEQGSIVSKRRLRISGQFTVSANAVGWAAYAEPLAKWAWQRLVNRVDVWGGYWRSQITGDDSPTTRPALSRVGYSQIALPDLVRHFSGATPHNIIGFHSAIA